MSPTGAATPVGRFSRCWAHRDLIEAMLDRDLFAVRIHADLRAEHGIELSDHSVRRFIAALGSASPKPFRQMECAPGEEVQVDFGAGPMPMLDARRRRTHVLRVVLSHSCKGFSEAAPLFPLASHRYGRGAMCITSNKAIGDRPEMPVGDEVITTAILDRLLHSSCVLHIKGSSDRLRDLEESMQPTREELVRRSPAPAQALHRRGAGAGRPRTPVGSVGANRMPSPKRIQVPRAPTRSRA